MLGPHHQSYEVERHPGERDIQFYVEGLTFPDTNFSGLVSLSVSLVDTEVGTILRLGGGVGGRGQPGTHKAAEHWSPPDPLRGATLHRQRDLPSGPLDHDPQHPATPGAVCVQVSPRPPLAKTSK